MRLIDADALKTELLRMNFYPALVKAAIERMPSVDAVEVVHGRWMKVTEPLGVFDVDCVECSSCHESWIIDEDYCFDDFGGWKYCPNCGAKMDGERREGG